MSGVTLNTDGPQSSQPTTGCFAFISEFFKSIADFVCSLLSYIPTRRSPPNPITPVLLQSPKASEVNKKVEEVRERTIFNDEAHSVSPDFSIAARQQVPSVLAQKEDGDIDIRLYLKILAKYSDFVGAVQNFRAKPTANNFDAVTAARDEAFENSSKSLGGYSINEPSHIGAFLKHFDDTNADEIMIDQCVAYCKYYYGKRELQN